MPFGMIFRENNVKNTAKAVSLHPLSEQNKHQ